MAKKELSIIEKAKAYDQALAHAKLLLKTIGNATLGNIVLKNEFERMFSELKESEDDEIRKWIRKELESKYVVDNIVNNVMADKALAWLERQGKNSMGISEVTKQKLEDNLNKALEKETPESCNEFLEKQGEQKFADKVEPKFHEGEWIAKNDESPINIDYSCCKITNVENGNYTIESIYGYKGYNTFETFEKDYHLWTIKDAKDGDVLYNRDDFAGNSVFIYKGISDKTHACFYYTRLFKDKDFCIYNDVMWKNGCGVNGGEFYPATKEQRDTLERAMTNAGYSFDFENKELKKIEQNSAWREEDKKMSRFIGNAITADGASEYLGSKGIQVIDAHMWLDELKDRVQSLNTWKPSEEQMKALDIAIRCGIQLGTWEEEALKSLKEQLFKLKKLKGE